MGLDVEIAGDFDGVVEFVVVAVGALGEGLVTAASVTLGGAGATVVEFDNIADVREFAVGLDVVFLDGFGERDIFDGAVSHDEEEGFVADSLAEAGEEKVGGFARETEVGELFGAGFGDVEIRVEGFDEIPVQSERGKVCGEAEAGAEGGEGGGAVRAEATVDTVKHVVGGVEVFGFGKDEATRDGGEDFDADGGSDVWLVVGRVVIVVVVRSGGDGDSLVGKFGAEAGDFGVFVGDLSEGEDANANAGESEDSEDEDNREEFVFGLVDFGLHNRGRHRRRSVVGCGGWGVNGWYCWGRISRNVWGDLGSLGVLSRFGGWGSWCRLSGWRVWHVWSI